MNFDFIPEFGKLDQSLGPYVTFFPRLVFMTCTVVDDCDSNFIRNNCYGAGKYCYEDPASTLSGRDIVLENLRQLCIWE